MTPDFERCWRAVRSRDTRFDGVFCCAVITTRVYCRPSCPGMPHRDNVRFYASAAQAQAGGFRACKRCRPDATPGSPDWDVRADVVGRALRLIADGVVDREGVAGLAVRLGYTTRHLHRQMVGELGVGAAGVARVQRARTARTLLETTDLGIGRIASAAGFSSTRQFNDTMRAVYDRSPTDLRASVRGRATTDAIGLRLPVRRPFDGGAVLRCLAADPTPDTEEVHGTAYRRALRLPHGTATVELRPGGDPDDHVDATLHLDDLRDLTAAIRRCRRLFDLDADPRAIAEVLRADEVIAPLVVARPGLRVAGHGDTHELAVRTTLGRYLDPTAERSATSALVRRHGSAVASPVGSVTHAFPDAATLARVPVDDWPVPDPVAARARAVSREIASGELVLDDGADREATRRRLADLLDEAAAETILLRGLKDPDVLPDAALARLEGLTAEHAARWWRPWRSYAATYLWSSAPARTRARAAALVSDG